MPVWPMLESMMHAFYNVCIADACNKWRQTKKRTAKFEEYKDNWFWFHLNIFLTTNIFSLGLESPLSSLLRNWPISPSCPKRFISRTLWTGWTLNTVPTSKLNFNFFQQIPISIPYFNHLNITLHPLTSEFGDFFCRWHFSWSICMGWALQIG